MSVEGPYLESKMNVCVCLNVLLYVHLGIWMRVCVPLQKVFFVHACGRVSAKVVCVSEYDK